MLAWNFTEQNVTIVLNGKIHTVSRTIGQFPQIVDALEDGDEAALETLLVPKANMEKVTEGRITFDGQCLRFKGEPLHNAIVDRLHHYWTEGLPVRPLLRFLDRLMDNPSYRAVNELYGFLEATDLPFTNDGCFLAYKRVRNNFKDIHSGTIDNSVGQSPRLSRNQVDEDPEQTCSYGLHVCSRSYLPYFGAWGSHKVVIVKVDPLDVVAVPKDYNNAKMRVCGYEVVQDISDDFNNGRDEAMPSYHTDDFSDEDDFEDDVEDDGDGSFDDLNDGDTLPVDKPTASVHATSAKLNEHQVRDIKELLRQGELSLVAIGNIYGVNESTIRKIRDGITWSWVQ